MIKGTDIIRRSGIGRTVIGVRRITAGSCVRSVRIAWTRSIVLVKRS